MITVSLQGGIAMIEKWKKWVLKMNLKRAALIFVVSSVVLILVLLAEFLKEKCFAGNQLLCFLQSAV